MRRCVPVCSCFLVKSGLSPDGIIATGCEKLHDQCIRRSVSRDSTKPLSPMRTVTLQVLEGLERGQTYERLPIPVSIGREEENTIRLNDERVSRFHAKIQEDGGRTILTDLDSTNGIRVNGRPVQMRVLKPGDQIAIGRCLLLFGSADEIRARIEKGRLAAQAGGSDEFALDDDVDDSDGSDGSFRVSGPLPELPPELPSRLSPGQRAELADLLGHIHDELRRVVTSSEELPSADQEMTDMRAPGSAWQRLLRLEMDLAVTLRRIADPDPVSNDSTYGVDG